jgi:hypothetical protein
MLQTKALEGIKTHILRSLIIFSKNRAVYEIMWGKFCRAGQATDGNMAHAYCVLDTEGYKHKLTISNNY